MQKKVLTGILSTIMILIYFIAVLLIMNATIVFGVNYSLSPRFGFIYSSVVAVVLVLMFLLSIYVQKTIARLKKEK